MSIMEIAELTEMLRAGRSLSRTESRQAFEMIMTGQVDIESLSGFLKSLADKGETVDEIAGAADVMNEKVQRVRCDADCIDTCGTGGDGISTFNVSTTAALIAAGAGAVVAKHGNRTNTRVSGSAEAIGVLGVNLDADVATLEHCLAECRIAFLYAPRLHPAMKFAAPARAALRMRTIFNILGPLTNPAGAKRQLLGTHRPELARTLAEVLSAREASFAWVVNAHNGLCDLSITGPTTVVEVSPGGLRTFEVVPEELGLEPAPLDTLIVDSPEASGKAIRAILEGHDQGPRRRHALLNAGAALCVADMAADLDEGVALAAEAVDSGKARLTLQRLIAHSQPRSG
jgi:anthranilate phosphoribosyltransferase